jgi:foldase protein PrsA
LDKNDIKKREETAVKYLKYGFIAFIAIVVVTAAIILLVSYSNSYIATVGSEKVTVPEFNFFLKQVKSTMLYDAGVQEGTPEAETYWSTTRFEGEDAIVYAKKRALEQAKELKVQLIVAKERGIKLEKNEINMLEQNLKSFAPQGATKSETDEYFKEILGVNLGEAVGIYKQILLANKLTTNEMENIKVSETDIEEYYKGHPDVFTNTIYRNKAEEAVWARHILITTPEEVSEEATDEEKQEYEKALEEARKKAEEVLAKAKNGEDFAGLAKQFSEDPGSASYGGDYVFGRNKMVPEFEEVAFDELEPGEISGLVKTIHGFHIIKTEEKIPEGEPVSLRCAKEYREFGESVVRGEKLQKTLESWKSEYEIQIKKSVYNSIQ